MMMYNGEPEERMTRKEQRVLDKDARKRLREQRKAQRKKMSNLSFENGGPMRDTLLNKIARNK